MHQCFYQKQKITKTVRGEEMFMDTNKIIVGVVLLGASLVLADLLLEECSQKEKIVAGALIGAGNGAFIGSAIGAPAGTVAGAAVGAALGGWAGKNYDDFHKHSHKREDRR